MSADNIGITLAETPLMRKAMKLIKPDTVHKLAVCLAIIRPAAKNTKKEFELNNFSGDQIIFDDDAIQIISREFGCSEDMADKIRRDYIKNNL